MTLTVACPSCKHKVKIKEDLVGRKVRCPRCREVYPILAPEDAEPEPPPQPRAAKPPPLEQREDDDVDEQVKERSTKGRKKTEDADEAPSLLRSELTETNIGMRILGVLALGIGTVMTYFGVYQTIAEANAGKPDIKTYEGVAAISVGALLMGLIMLIGGKQVKRFFVFDRNKLKPLQVLGTLLIVLVCVIFQVWFDLHLKGLGYTVRFPGR